MAQWMNERDLTSLHIGIPAKIFAAIRASEPSSDSRSQGTAIVLIYRIKNPSINPRLGEQPPTQIWKYSKDFRKQIDVQPWYVNNDTLRHDLNHTCHVLKTRLKGSASRQDGETSQHSRD